MKTKPVCKKWVWPFQRINSNGAKEYACRHGIGHGGIHGCDGCCSDPNFPGSVPTKKVKKPRKWDAIAFKDDHGICMVLFESKKDCDAMVKRSGKWKVLRTKIRVVIE